MRVTDPSHRAPRKSEPLVTVVIPARNEKDHIERCLSSIQRQTHSTLQIIVIDADSDDGTDDIVRSVASTDDRVELVVNPDRLIPIGLNKAVDATRGEWLVRVDAHSTIPEDYVERALRHLTAKKWGGVGGRKDGVGLTPQGRAVAAAMGSRFGVGGSVYHYGTEVQIVDHIPFGCYPVDVIKEVGGWNEELAVNQDFEFDHRVQEAGYQLLFDPELRIDWHSRQSIAALFRQYRRYGKGKTEVMRRHPKSTKARHLAAPVLVAALLSALVLAPFRPKWSVAVVGNYLVSSLAASAITARSMEPKAALDSALLPPAFAAMHIGWGIGFFEGWLHQLRRHRSSNKTQ